MKKFEKIKNKLIGLGTIMITLPTKVFAKELEIQPLYGVTNNSYYKITIISKILKIAIIPIILIIGFIIYLIKKKNNKKKKEK